MQGPTLTMSPAFDSTSAFHRSHSSPHIPDLVKVDYQRPVARGNEELPRSASFTALPALDSHYNSPNELHRIASASADLPVDPPKDSYGMVEQDERMGNRLEKEERPKLERQGRRKSLVARPKSWIQRVKGSPERQPTSDAGKSSASETPPVPTTIKATRDARTKSVSETFATFARKSWISSSRSPSPNRSSGKDTEGAGQPDAESKAVSSPLSMAVQAATVDLEEPTLAKVHDSPTKPDSRRVSTLQKIKQRPQSVLMNLTSFQSTNSSASSLQRSSLDNKSTPRTSVDKVPPLPALSTEKLQSFGIHTPRRRDELWSAFRSLENDFTKFQGKSWSLKTNVVRSSLLPFLRNHAEHPSNKTLRPEDLDRRITILNKWWGGLLEVLDGRQNQTVSGVDRPVLLDACYEIMTRPEWRLPPSQYASLADRSLNHSPLQRPLPRQKSSGSLSSSASQFMIESTHHNVRNLFIQNLLTQLSFVVDKMSLRHAPASLVTFCGKAAAYSFFFVPGIAEILVRIWKLQPDILRRVTDALGLPKLASKLETEEVAAPFPVHLQCLGWSSVKSMASTLRQAPNPPIMASKINWHGPWVARWCGRDSDLFFVFVKHYHILAEEYMPSELPLTSKSRAPGFVLVQGQILSALDATIHRQPPAEPLPITFDDVLAGADASAAALPLSSTNSARSMAENRLIMLLRDFVSERPSDYVEARLTFAVSFGRMMQALAQRTSLFDHNACFVLCDFMEEALTIYVRFHHAHALEYDFIDWYFWLDVCKKMLDSHNSMSEIRLFAFIYTTWSMITNDEKRKEILCLEWLLAEETFDKFFNHWCPMVRAYYMRLLCWRLCRDHGDATNLDTKIFSVALTRIKSVWAHYLFQKQVAEKSHVLAPSTAPCHPAPGRRLLIMRNDNHTPAANIFLGFDGIMPGTTTVGQVQQATSRRHSGLSIPNGPETSNPQLTADSSSTAPNKKRWTFMGKMIPASFGAESSPSQSQASSRGSSPNKSQTLEDARRETAMARTRPFIHTKTSSTDSETPPSTMTHRTYSFKFSLEWAQHFEKPANNINGSGSQQNMHSAPGNRGGAGFNVGSERRIYPPRLPAPAQSHVGVHVPGISNELMPRDPGKSISHGETSKLDKAAKIARAKYSGRALAEWGLIVGECNSFVERRCAEGVPGLKWVEVPTLGIEGFRKFGG